MPDTEAISLIQDSGPVDVTPSAMGVMPAVRSVLSFGDTTESAPNAVQPQGQDPYQIQQPYFMPPYRPMATIPDYQLSGIYQTVSTQTPPANSFNISLSDGMNWRGVWNISPLYNQFDVVLFNTAAYIALTANFGKQPDINAGIWQLLSENFVFGASPSVVSGLGTFDKSSTTAGNGSSLNAGAVTPSTSNELAIWFGGFGSGGSPESVSSIASIAPAGWNTLGVSSGVMKAIYQQQPTTASLAPTATIGAARNWCSIQTLWPFGGNITNTATSVQIGLTNNGTILCANKFTAGQTVTFSGFVGASFLNGNSVVISTATATQFTFTFAHAPYGPTADSGTVTLNPYLQQVNASINLTSGTATYSPGAVAAGDTIIINWFCDTNFSPSQITGVSDTLGNNYHIINNTQGDINLCIAYAQNVAAGTPVITANLSNTTGGNINNSGAVMIEMVGSTLLYLPYDVFMFRGSIFVCLTETSQDAYANPSAWGQLAQGTGFVDNLSGNYNVLATDVGRLITNQTSSNFTVTMPTIIPNNSFWLTLNNASTGTIILDPNGRTIDGVGGTITLSKGQGLVLFSDGNQYYAMKGIGTVSSVALTMPAEFIVSGSPVTGSGTLAVTKATESANTAWMGPTSGAAAAPTFRQPQDLDLSLADITTNNVSTTAHGFAPKLPNDSTKFLNGIGTYTVPAGGGGGGSAGGVNAQTSNYTAVSGDNGKLITFNSASAVTLTLPNPAISSTWWISVQNVGAGVLTVNPNSLNLDGSGNSILIPQNQGLAIFTDGTNYFTDRGYGGGLIAKVDITGRTSAIGTTTFSNTGTGLQAGMYCVYGYLDITTAASSGTISITISYTDDSGSDSQTTTGVAVGALHDNGGFAIPLFSTANNTISYATTFNSVIGTPTYAIHLWLVAIPGTPISSSFGGVNSQTADYTAVAADSGKLLSFNKATAVNLTLPSSPPSSNWYINVENRGAGILNILRNGLTIDGANISFYLKQNQGCNIYTDGSNYFLQIRDTGIPRFNTRRNTSVLANGSTGTTLATALTVTGDTLFIGSGGLVGTVASAGNPASIAINSPATSNAVGGDFSSNNNVYFTGTNMRFQTMAKINDFASGRFWYGMITANMDGSANPSGNYAAFRADKSVPDTNFQCITKDNVTQTITDSGIAIDTGWHRFEIIFNDNLATPNVQFFIDGALVATNTTHLPSASTGLLFNISCASTASSARKVFCAWVYIESDL